MVNIGILVYIEMENMGKSNWMGIIASDKLTVCAFGHGHEKNVDLSIKHGDFPIVMLA